MVWVLVWGTAPPGPPTHPKGLCLRRQPEVREQVGPGPEPLEAGSPQPSTAPSAGEGASSLWTVCLGLLPASMDLPCHSIGTSAGQLLSPASSPSCTTPLHMLALRWELASPLPSPPTSLLAHTPHRLLALPAWATCASSPTASILPAVLAFSPQVFTV